MSINNPYKGLFPFTAVDEKIFFGRDKEAYDLVEMIKNNQLVVFYGESGTGKTSLINAKLFPELKRQYYFPINIRINYLAEKDPLAKVRQLISAEFKKLDPSVPEFTNELSLIEFAAKTNIYSGLVKPILFFDQFEELFTLAPKHVAKPELDNFINQLGDLIEARLPKLKKKVVSSIAAEYDIHADPFKEHEVELKNKVVEDICIENLLRFTVVFSLRQDYIAQLDDLRFQIPSITSNRFRLKRFTDSQALDAILKPAEEYKKALQLTDKSPEVLKTLGLGEEYPDIIDGVTADEVINQLKKLEADKVYRPTEEPPAANLLEQFKFVARRYWAKLTGKDKKTAEEEPILPSYNIDIDPTILSLYCFQLFNAAVAAQGKTEQQKAQAQITLTQVKASPCDELIKNYYNESLSTKKEKTAVETLLITPDGRRVLMLLREFIAKSKFSPAFIQSLRAKTAILRTYGDGDSQEVELAHDQIAKQALASKKRREANQITRTTVTFLIIIAVAIVLAGITILLQLKENERNTTVQKLQLDKVDLSTQLLKQEDSVSTLNDSLSVLNKNYSTILTSSNTVLTDKESINKQVNLLKSQLINMETLFRNLGLERDFLNKRLISMGSENKTLENKIDSLTATNNLLKKENDRIKNQLDNAQNAGNDKGGNKGGVDSLAFYRQFYMAQMKNTKSNIDAADTTKKRMQQLSPPALKKN